ncbi:MAG: sigma 54-interacting transcriptional regulator [Polyangiales bacterium]
MDGPDLTAVRQTLRRTSQGKIIGRHPSVREAIETIERVATTTCNVLITGESGTGKELFVAALHDASLRAQGPLVPVNCGAIPKDLLESALFGHTRGAFSGAVNNRSGYVGAAEGGTLFLDEIGEMPTSMQVALLRLIQKHEYVPVGEAKALKCDIRVVAATHRDLEAEVAAGRFREDLYYRLNVVTIHLPPLRARGADVESLALFFLQHCAARVNREGLAGFDPEAMEALRNWTWPGNVRELENAIERAVLLARSALVTVADLPKAIREHHERAVAAASTAAPEAPPEPVPSSLALAPEVPMAMLDPVVELPAEGVDFRAAVEAYENKLLRVALERTGGNRNQAASLLRLNRTTLVEMLRRKRIKGA